MLLAPFTCGRFHNLQIAAELSTALADAEAYLADHPYLKAPPLLETKLGAEHVQIQRDHYLEAQRAIVESGMRTTATMVIGFDETLEERLEHLQRTRDFQDACLRDGYDGLFSFLCWTYKPYGTALGGREISANEYWRHMALSRIFLDNVRHFRTSVLTQNEDAFRALDYGADDFDLPIEDEVTQKAGAKIDLDLERLLEVPRRLGYRVEYRRAERPAALSAS